MFRTGQWAEAQRILEEVEREAPGNADLLTALARAYRRESDDRRALQYFTRAKALAPNDPDVVDGYEAAVRSYGHQVQFEGFGEHPIPFHQDYGLAFGGSVEGEDPHLRTKI